MKGSNAITLRGVIQSLIMQKKIGKDWENTGRVISSIGRLNDPERKEAYLILQNYCGQSEQSRPIDGKKTKNQ